MRISLSTGGALLVTGAGVTTSLLTSQQGGSKLTPRWYEKVKGEKGFLYHTHTKGKQDLWKIAKGLEEGGEWKRLVGNRGNHQLTPCFGRGGGGDRDHLSEKPCSEVFVGWFYEENREEESKGSCMKKIKNDRSKVCGVSFVAEREFDDQKMAMRELGLNLYNDCDGRNEGVTNYEMKKCRFLEGPRETFINLWMSSGKK